MGSTLYPLTFILSPSSGGEENVSGVVGQFLAGLLESLGAFRPLSEHHCNWPHCAPDAIGEQRNIT